MSDYTAIDIEFDPTQQRMQGVARHGMTPFDCPFISHIDGNLWQGGCRDGLILPREIKHLISLYPWERYKVRHELETEMYVRMYDAELDSVDRILDIAMLVHDCAERGPTLVHCQAGLNRSGLIAATALLYAGWSPKDTIAVLREKRSPAVLCNPYFEKWLLESAIDEMNSRWD